MLDDNEEEWMNVDWDELEQAALQRKREGQQAGRQSCGPISSPPAGSQHSFQPPTPSALTLVQPAVQMAPHPGWTTLSGGPAGQAAFHPGPTAHHSAAALHREGLVQQPTAAARQPQLPDSQGSSDQWPSVASMPASSSAHAELDNHARFISACSLPSSNIFAPHSHPGCIALPPSSTVGENGPAPQTHASSNALPPSASAGGSNGLRRSSWDTAADLLAERRCSANGAGCSGHGAPPRVPSPLKPVTNTGRACHGGHLPSPPRHPQPQPQQELSWGGHHPHATVSTPAQLQGNRGPSAVQLQSGGPPRAASLLQQPGHQQQMQPQQSVREGQFPRGSSCRLPHLQPQPGRQDQQMQQQHRGGIARRNSSGVPAGNGAPSDGRPRMSLADLRRRVDEFRELLPRLDMPPSSYAKCPGVFKVAWQAGCGADLQPVKRTIPSIVPGAPEEVVEFWGCSLYPACDFRDVLPKRLAVPQVTLEAVSTAAFKVMPAVGAEQVIEHCGGMRALLGDVGVDLSKALANVVSDVEEGGKPAVLFAWEHYDTVVAALSNKRQHNLDLIGKAGLIPSNILAAHKGRYEKASDEEVQERFESMSPALARALMAFQAEGVRFALRRGGRALIADEMGVGKTVQAIALASCYQEEWPLLVVAPASLRLVWAEELARWLPHTRASAVHVIEGRTDRLEGGATPQVVITSYEMLANLTCKGCCAGGTAINRTNTCAGADHCMAARGFKVIIVDESHTLRTTDRAPDSRGTEAAVASVRAARRAVLLSGTPSLSRPYDLFRQVDALRSGLLGRNREAFAHRYCNRRLVPVFRGGQQKLKWCNTGLAHAAELHALLKQEVMLRRLKREVMAQLPPKRRQVVRLPKPSDAHFPPQPRSQAAQETCTAEGGSEDEEDLGDADVDASVDVDGDVGADEATGQPAAMSVGQRTGLAKLPNVLEWLRHALGSGGRSSASQAAQDALPKFLVFAHHRSVMAALAAALEGEGSSRKGEGGERSKWAGAEYVRIEGATDHRDRRAAAARFRDDPSVRVALLSVTAAGTGLDFSAASAVVFAELPEEVSLVRQAEDRAHRHSQRFPVNVYFLLARGTSDERRWQILNRSLERVTAVHDGGGAAAASAPGSPAAADAALGDMGGIALDAVRDVGDGLGWGCTQALPQQLSTELECSPSAAEPPAPEADDAAESAAVLPGSQQEALTVTTDNEAEDSAGIVADSDDDEEWSPTARGPATELQKAGGTTGGGTQEPEQAAAPGSSAEQLVQAGSSPAAADVDCVSPEADVADDRSKVWFEVSRHTNRVHFHGAADGGCMLGLSLPMDILTVPREQGTPQTVLDLLAAVDDREGGKAVVGQAGLLALGPGVSAGEVERWIGEARDFAAEWAELRAVHQNQLAGTPLRWPLQDALAALEAKATAAGAYGLSTERQLDGARPHLPPPPGAELATVHVRYVGRANTVAYKQAFTADGRRLCIHCMKPVETSVVGPTAVLEGAADLFCGVACEAAYALRTGGGGLRRALFKLERGVCQSCHLDCKNLVERLRVIEKGTRNWKARRQKKLAALAPNFTAHGFKAAGERLVAQCLEGNAWHADHIRPVYKGGGLCQLENLRTLCVPCHQVVTKKQAAERAAERKLRNQHTLHTFLPALPRAASASAAPVAAGAGAVQGAAGAAARPRRQLKRVYTEDAPDPDFQSPPRSSNGAKKRR